MYLELEDGTEVLVSFMLDIDGDETSDPHEAHAAIAELPDGRWIVQEINPDLIVERASH